MYALTSSLVLEAGGWKNIDVSNLDFSTLYEQYGRVYLNLYENIQKQEVCLDLNEPSFRRKARYLKTSVANFLIANADQVLPTKNGYRSLVDINRHHYYDRATEPELTKVDPTVMGYAYSSNRPLVKSPDLLLANLPDAYTSCIATAAGLAHIIKPVPQGSCVELGHETMMGFNDKNFGLHDFKELGTVRQFPLRKELLSRSDNGFVISLEEDITNKLVLLVINGSIFYTDATNNTFTQHSPKTIFLNSSKVPWKNLILSTQRELDLSHLELLRVPNGDSSIAVEQLEDADMHERMLLGPRSFAVLITPHDENNPISVGTDYFFDAGLNTGTFMGGELAPAGIMLNERNQPVNYINQRQDDIYIIRANQYKSLVFAHETAPWELNLNIDDSRRMDSRFDVPTRLRNLSFYQVK